MVGGAMTRGEYVQLLTIGLHKIFNQWTDQLMANPSYDLVFNKEDSVNAFEDELEFAGTGPMVEKPEGSSVFYTDMIQGGVRRYVMFTYALGLRASYELVNDDKYGIIKNGPKALMRSARFTKGVSIWSILNNGFTTTITTDGVSLFNNQHPLLGGSQATAVGPGVGNVISAAGTYPNRPATDADLSMTALQLAVNQQNRLIDGVGIPVEYKFKYVVIPPELLFIARELLGSPQKPYTSDNEINAMVGENLQYMTERYLTSQSAWFCLPDKKDHTLKYFDRTPLTDDYDDDFDTRSVKQIIFGRWGAGVTVWGGTWGSNGP